MRALQITLFVLALSALSAQAFRDAYVKWLEPRTSVLDQFKEKTESAVSKARDLAALVELYKDAHNKVQEYEQSHPGDTRAYYERLESEPYKSAETIKNAIQEWESTARERHDVISFWCFGIVALAAGIWLYRSKKLWLGMALIITGFAEMVWWSSPSFRSLGSPEVERLLTTKLILSFISWLLLLIVWELHEQSRRLRLGKPTVP